MHIITILTYCIATLKLAAQQLTILKNGFTMYHVRMYHVRMYHFKTE